jgi:hypothetical protein
MINTPLDFPDTKPVLNVNYSKHEIKDVMDEYRTKIELIAQKLNTRTTPVIQFNHHIMTNVRTDQEVEKLINESEIKVQKETEHINELERELFVELDLLCNVMVEAQKKLENEEWLI